jgi:uncharacterized membrane protein YkvA (DUF1232 family)
MCLNNSETLAELFNEAAKKAAAVPREPFKEYWPYLQTMLRLVRAHHRGEYNQVPDNALLWVVAALSYLIDPFDLIPDKTPFLGFVDDATVVEFVADRTRQTLDDFMAWKRAVAAELWEHRLPACPFRQLPKASSNVRSRNPIATARASSADCRRLQAGGLCSQVPFFRPLAAPGFPAGAEVL